MRLDHRPTEECYVKVRFGEAAMGLTDEDKAWISEQLEPVETNLLTEFHKWASPVEMRSRSHAAAIRALDVEVESLSDRLKKLERTQ
jgi:hypothetical protein